MIAGSIDEGGRSLNEVRVYSADRSRPRLAPRPPRRRVVRLPRLADPAAALAGLALLVPAPERGLAAALGLGAVVPVLLALGTHFPLYSPLWHAFPPLRYPRVPERLMPIACLALAALAAFAIDAAAAAARGRGASRALALAARRRRRCCSPTCTSAPSRPRRPTARTPPTPPSASAPQGRLLELPVFLPDVHYGSVYLYYDQRVRRQRPAGYSTTAPRTRRRGRARRSQPLGCGDWTTGAGAQLDALGVAAITLHRGLYARQHARRRHRLARLARPRSRTAGGRSRPTGRSPPSCRGRSAAGTALRRAGDGDAALLRGLVPAGRPRAPDEPRPRRALGLRPGDRAAVPRLARAAARVCASPSTAGRTRA